MEKSYTIYKHTSPSDKVYIGITSQKPENRWRKGKDYKTCPYFYLAILKYGWDNIKHEILFKQLTKQEAELMEQELISLYKSNQREFGYNIESGGNLQKEISEETRHKISEANKKRVVSEETKKKISETLKLNYHHTIEGNNGNSRKIIQMLDNKIIATFDSISQAIRKNNFSLNVNSNICKCCKGKLNKVHGFQWKYLEEV